MSKVDLDEAQRLCEHGNATVLLPLVAELRAAREVIGELGPLLAGMRSMHAQTSHAGESPCGWCRLIHTYDAYEKVTGESQ